MRLSNRIHIIVVFLLAGAILLLLVAQCLMCAVPPVSRDALTHHLALPKIFQSQGGLVELPDIPFSYYPMNLDLLYWGAMALINDTAPKYVHLLFGVLTGALLGIYLRPRFGIVYSLLGTLLWLSTPMVLRLSSEVYVDLGLGFFSGAAVYHVIRWIRMGFRLRSLVIAGIFCGLALGTKYNALLVLAVLSLMVPFIFSRLSSREYAPAQTPHPGCENALNVCRWQQTSIRSIAAAVIFVAVALVVFSPWMLRNTMLKGNPLYPMFHSLFNSQGEDQDNWSRSARQETFNTFKIRRMVFKESYAEIALLPVRIFWQGRDDDPKRFDGQLNPWLLIFALASFLPVSGEPVSLKTERWIWFVFAVLFMAMAFFTAPIRIRYLIPILPGIVLLSINGMVKVHTMAKAAPARSLRRRLLWVLLTLSVLAMLGYNGRYAVARFAAVQPLTYLGGKVSRDAYIAQRRPEYPLIQYANRHLEDDSKLLGIFVGQRRYYFDRGINFDENLLLRAVIEGEQAKEVLAYLQTHGISHLFIRLDLFRDWLSRNLDADQQRIFMAFWQAHVSEVKSINGFALYRLHE